MLKELLQLAYEREIELEDLLERPLTKNKWFVEDLKQLNIDIQNVCLAKLGKQAKIKEHKKSLH